MNFTCTFHIYHGYGTLGAIAMKVYSRFPNLRGWSIAIRSFNPVHVAGGVFVEMHFVYSTTPTDWIGRNRIIGYFLDNSIKEQEQQLFII